MSRKSIPVVWGKGGDFQEFGHCPRFFGLVTVIVLMDGSFIIG